jgi:hypothetical protein
MIICLQLYKTQRHPELVSGTHTAGNHACEVLKQVQHDVV